MAATEHSAHAAALSARPTSSAMTGKATEPLKTLVPEVVALDFEKFWRERGYPSASDCLRECVMVILYGSEALATLHADRIKSMGRNLTAMGSGS